MPKLKNKKEIQELMGKKERVRNIGIIAHADYGKTTLLDCILEGVGLISGKKERWMDYFEEEQKRGITIKAGVVSFVYRQKEDKDK